MAQVDHNPVDTFRLLESRACGLEEHNFDAFYAFLQQVEGSGLPRSRRLALIKIGRGFAKFNAEVAKEVVAELREASKEARAEAFGDAVKAGVSREVYVRDQGKVFDPRSGILMAERSFLVGKARDHGGDVAEATETWLTGAQALCEQVDRLTYDPGLPSGIAHDFRGVPCFNTWRGSVVQPRGAGTEEDVRPWLDLLRALRLEEGEAGESWLLDRLAWSVQNPGVKINHGVLLGGDKGIGKDSLLAPVIQAIGEQNAVVVHGEELASDFTDYLRCKLLVVNEIDYGTHKDRRRIAEKLKPVLAAPPDRLRINEKNLRPYEIRNLVSVIGMTNHRICLHADDGERRWLMLWAGLQIPSGGQPREAWDEWFAGYWDWLNQEGVSRVLAYLRRRDVSGFNPGARPPETRWLRDVQMQSRDGLESWLLEEISRGQGIFEANVVASRDVLDLLQTGRGNLWVQGHVDFRRLARAFHGIGAQPSRTGIRKSGSREKLRAWIIRPERHEVEGTGMPVVKIGPWQEEFTPAERDELRQRKDLLQRRQRGRWLRWQEDKGLLERGEGRGAQGSSERPFWA